MDKVSDILDPKVESVLVKENPKTAPRISLTMARDLELKITFKKKKPEDLVHSFEKDMKECFNLCDKK